MVQKVHEEEKYAFFLNNYHNHNNDDDNVVAYTVRIVSIIYSLLYVFLHLIGFFIPLSR